MGRSSRRVRSLPGVEAVGFTSDLPVRCDCDTDWIRIPGRPFHGEHNDVMERDVSVDYLTALGARLERGRMFTEQDDAKHPYVTVINETLARKYFPGEDALGKTIGNPQLDPKQMREVVGVVADIREAALDDAPAAGGVLPDQTTGRTTFSQLAVRTKGDEKALLPELVKTLRGINPNLGVYGELTMAEPDRRRRRRRCCISCRRGWWGDLRGWRWCWAWWVCTEWWRIR